MTRHRVAEVTDIAVGGLRRVAIGDIAVCLVHGQDDEFYAIRDVCSHEEVPLSEGWVDGCTIECALHNSVFDLRTGEPVSLPATQPIITYPVTIRGRHVYVDL
jgi:3-phenylpropionate/trans-cinnamate dioxygenase ferredoxin subunit